MRAYVTGSSGFVGGWLRSLLEASGDEIVSTDIEVDVTDPDAITKSIVLSMPDVVYHLAALAHVGQSWKNPAETFRVNAIGTLNVVQAAAECAAAPRVLVISSAEVYGNTAGDLPVTESAELRPLSPYAASKVAAEFIGVQGWLGMGVPVVRARPFNHLGPGQSPEFVVSALAKRVALAERDGGGDVAVGNLEASRDFTDVRDVVRAYRLLASHGTPGDAYNVAAGKAVTIADVASRLCALARSKVDLAPDKALIRPVDVPIFLGDASKLRAATGWQPQIPLDETLLEVLDYWREHLA